METRLYDVINWIIYNDFFSPNGLEEMDEFSRDQSVYETLLYTRENYIIMFI